MTLQVVSACACVLLAAAVCAGGLGAVGTVEALSFVSRDGARFVLDGAPFYVTGANQVCLDTLALAGAGFQQASCRTLAVCKTRIVTSHRARRLSPAHAKYNLMTYASYGPTQKAEVLAVLVRSALWRC